MSEESSHTRNSVEIAWTKKKGRFEVIMMLYGRKKHFEDEIKKHSWQIASK